MACAAAKTGDVRTAGALNPMRAPSIGILGPRMAPAIGVAALATVTVVTAVAIGVFVSGCCSVLFSLVGVLFAFINAPTTAPTTSSATITAALIPPCAAGLSIIFVTGALFAFDPSNPLRIVSFLVGV